MILKDKIRQLDRERMYTSIYNFPDQIIDSKLLMSKIVLRHRDEINSILVCGMGGSAIGADLVKSITSDVLDKQISINRDYKLPKWVDSKTLIILSSFSGNTEEVLSCLEDCKINSFKPIIISTGGKLVQNAIEHNFEYIQFENNKIQPRAAVGYSISLLLLLLNRLSLLSDGIVSELDVCHTVLQNYRDELLENESSNCAISFAEALYESYPIIYSSSNIESLAFRFRCQLAENSKMLSSHFSIPEQNHNEIEGFLSSKTDAFVIVWIDSFIDNNQVEKRFNVTQNILENSCKKQILLSEYMSLHDKSKFISIMLSVYFLDWVSYYLGILNNVNPSEIPNIKKIKSNL